MLAASWSSPLHWPRCDEHVPEYVGAVGHQAVDTAVEQLVASPSGSSMVHTCTCLPAACARRTEPAVATTAAAARGAGPAAPTGRPRVSRSASRALGGSTTNATTSSGRADGGHPAAGAAAGTRAAGGPTNEPTSTRSQRRARLDEVGERPDRAVGLDVDVEAGVGELVEQLGQRRDLLAAADQRAPHLVVRSARRSRPAWSVTRSRTVSWKASSTPSLVACTSVSR